MNIGRKLTYLSKEQERTMPVEFPRIQNVEMTNVLIKKKLFHLKVYTTVFSKILTNIHFNLVLICFVLLVPFLNITAYDLISVLEFFLCDSLCTEHEQYVIVVVI